MAGLDLAVTGFGVAPSAQGLHSASIPGILALDLCPADTNKILTGESRSGPAGRGGAGGRVGARSCPLHGPGGRSTVFSRGTRVGMTHCWISFGSFPGGADKNVVVFDKSSEQILATLKGHTKKVTSVVFHPSQVKGPASHPGSLIPVPWFWWFRVADPVTQRRAVSL